MNPPLPVIIVGAGLAGLCCGRRLAELGIPFRILEASDAVGGRVRTDMVDGFRLDRGFQIYLPGYPEGRRVLDYAALDLKSFTRGAIVRFGGKFHRVADPRAEFGTAVKSIFGPIGSVRDKLKLIHVVRAIVNAEFENATDQPTIDLLRIFGLSDTMIDRLFRPFLGGVFLESDLATSARFFRFVFQQFATTAGAVPALGMGEIPNQIALKLPADSIRLNSPVTELLPGRVVLKTGEILDSKAVVVATEAATAKRLLKDADVSIDDRGNGTVTLYYSTPQPPVAEPILVLNGERQGVVNSIVNMSACSPAYAPLGQALLSVSIVGHANDDRVSLERTVRNELVSWYGEGVNSWRLLECYHIPYALPEMKVGQLDPWQRPVRVRPGVYVCGDHRAQGSINGAMQSGFQAAQAVAEDRQNRLF